MDIESQLADGLTKREQAKLDKLIKDEANAANTNKDRTHAKSYKRKTFKVKRAEEAIQRKRINESDNGGEQLSESGQYVLDKGKNNMEGKQIKKKLKSLKPFNPNFKVDGGEEGFFGYIMTYAYTQKQKKIDSLWQDPSFLDLCKGELLQIVSKDSKINKQISEVNLQFQKIKQDIQFPFDQTHKNFVKKISSTNNNLTKN